MARNLGVLWRSLETTGFRSKTALNSALSCSCIAARRSFTTENDKDFDVYASHRRSTGRPDRIRFFENAIDPKKNPFNPALFPEQVRYEDPLSDLQPAQREISNEIVTRINNQIASGDHGRLFAVIQMANRQFRVTDEDVIMILGTYHLAVGEKVKIEKVLAVGSKDFTLLGRPMLDRGFVNVDATAIEKTLSYPLIKMIHIKSIPRRIRRFDRLAQTMVRINRVSFNRQLNEKQDSENMVYDLR